MNEEEFLKEFERACDLLVESIEDFRDAVEHKPKLDKWIAERNK